MTWWQWYWLASSCLVVGTWICWGWPRKDQLLFAVGYSLALLVAWPLVLAVSFVLQLFDQPKGRRP